MTADHEFLARTFALDGRVAVVTGASSGLGAHLAMTLARAGAKVALAARRRDKLAAVAAAIGEAVGDETAAVPVAMDVTERASVDAGFAEIVARFGRVDILINNAGIAAPAGFLDMQEADWRRVLDTDLTSVWRVGQAAARVMVGQKSGGAIINIASVMGFAAAKSQANYGAAKAGVIHLTKTMALELARQNIRVNALAPGYFATEINQDFLANKRGQAYIQSLLPGRCGELAELDGAVLLLAGDAGSYVNGSVVVVDGGMTAGKLYNL